MVSECCSRVCPEWGKFFGLKPQAPHFLMKDVLEESKCDFVEGEQEWGEVVFSFRDDRFTYIWDKSTGDIYNDDISILIRLKCACLVPRSMLQIVVNVVYNVARGAFDEVSRAISNGVGCIKAALLGVVSPYEGRKLYSMYERAYNRDEKQVDRKNKYYVALCFVPLNYNATDKTNRGISIEVLTRNILRNKYGFKL